jgi:hypothetical protein
MSPWCHEIATHTTTTRHIEEISKNPRIDPEAVMSITYLHEFDR